jgi:hypothetical protein
MNQETETPHTFENISYNYSIHSEFDLLIQSLPQRYDVQEFMLNDNPIDLSNLNHDNSGLKVKSGYLKSLSLGDYVFNIITNDGSFIFNLTIINTQRPYMVSKSSVTTDLSSNHTFLFELFGGNISSVSGHNINSNNYTISNNVLTIRRTFIKSVFENDETLLTMVLAYSLDIEGHTVIGNIFISKILEN